MSSGRFRNEYGVHKPICGGRCLVAHLGWYNMSPVSVLLLICPSALWYWQVLNNIEHLYRIPLAASVGSVLLFTLYYLALAQFTEPGILPYVRLEESSRNDNIGSRLTTLVMLEGREFPLTMFRAKISRVTKNCVEHFDHFCPWVGNAVGKRNYRYFFLFVTGALILAGLLTSTCLSVIILCITNYDNELVDTIKSHIPEVLLVVYGSIMFASLFLLWQFHVRAIAQNKTTNEILKHVYSKTNPNPYDKGCLRNFGLFCCKPLSKSRVAELGADSPLLPYERRANGTFVGSPDIPLLRVEESPVHLGSEIGSEGTPS
mmetsp:Transcript_5294/g.7020  ORF Transcript_5294/g.7020 Transcript_5294/m.7020 type:complete len:317 (-) Transcript_5294:284-1234(-)